MPVETTVGRVMFNEIRRPGMPFYNHDLDKKLANIIATATCCSADADAALLDDLKEIGFKARRARACRSARTTWSSRRPRTIIEETQKEVEKIHKRYQRRHHHGRRALQPDHRPWTHARERSVRR
jgi:DNA-directed RNA polymerase beta' subunit